MNIWNIKSKALRAIVAWLFAGFVAIVVLLALPVALVWLAAAGVWGGVEVLCRDKEARSIRRMWWRAATGKEAV